MNTISPGIDAGFVWNPPRARNWRPLARALWAGAALTLLLLAVGGWRLAICMASVQACMR